VANLFGAKLGEVGNAGGGEVHPGYPGFVLSDGQSRSMAWGFPLTLKGKSGQPLKPKPVNNKGYTFVVICPHQTENVTRAG
jgi:hypothetical protein